MTRETLGVLWLLASLALGLATMGLADLAARW